MLPILVQIYKQKRPQDIVVLSAGHAGLAQYVCIEMFERDAVTGGKIDAERLFLDHGTHPQRDPQRRLYATTGSLGCGITLAAGLAIADPERVVYCVMTDGECAEGSVWESLAFMKKQGVENMRVHVNVNGYAAYEEVDRGDLEGRLLAFCPSAVIHHTQNPKGLEGVAGHYKNITSPDDVCIGQPSA